MNITGRLAEQKIIAARLNYRKAELIAIYGRCQVGKTYLVRTFCQKNIVFEFTGIHEASMKTQLKNFSQAMQQAVKSPVQPAIPNSWLQAFTAQSTKKNEYYLGRIQADVQMKDLFK